MKKYLLTILCSVSTIILFSQSISIEAGVGIASLTEYEKSRFHWNGGVQYEHPLGKNFAANIGLSFEKRGGFSERVEIPYDFSYDYQLLSLPIGVEYTLLGRITMQGQFFAGYLFNKKLNYIYESISLALRQGDQFDSVNEFHDLEFGYNLGLIVKISPSLGLKVRYSEGLRRLYNAENDLQLLNFTTDNGVTNAAHNAELKRRVTEFRSTAFSVGIVYTINLNNK